MKSSHSIARRLALMFALAAALVFAVIDLALYKVQRMELHRHHAQEIRTRFDYISHLIARRMDSQEKWALLADKLKDLSSANGSVHYLITGPDPRYRWGEPLPSGGETVREGDGTERLSTPSGTFLILSGLVPANGDRPQVELTVAADPAAFDTTNHALGIALVGFSLLGVGGIAGLGWWLSRRSLAVVDRLSQHAQGLSPQTLSERLPTDHLPCELAGLVLSFNGALERVEQAYLHLSTFNADVAHELRTPIGNLIGQTQVILSRERPAEELSEVLQSNLEELERLRAIVNDMLFLAQADRGMRADNPVPASVAGEVAKSTEFLEMLIEEAEVSIRIEGDAEALIDPPLFGCAVTNLLHNAIQYGEPRSVIDVRIADRDDGVSIGVSNRGKPIPAHHLERLFDRFYRVDPARAGSVASHGLGLAIVKAIAVMHGGRVFACCKDGRTTIGFTVARSPMAA